MHKCTHFTMSSTWIYIAFLMIISDFRMKSYLLPLLDSSALEFIVHTPSCLFIVPIHTAMNIYFIFVHPLDVRHLCFFWFRFSLLEFDILSLVFELGIWLDLKNIF